MATKTPSYMRMYRDIKEKIKNEVYPVGAFLPTEAELQKEYSISRTTVRHAISLLQADGLIKVKQGYGTEIVRNKVSQSLNTMTSVSESLRKMGHEVGVSNMHIERVYASHELAEELNLEVGESVILVSRIQTCDGYPIALSKNYIPEKFVPGIKSESEKIISLYGYIKEKYSINITKIEDSLSASAATFDESVALQVEPKTALIVVRRICHNSNGPFEVDYVKIIANKYEYRNTLELEV